MSPEDILKDRRFRFAVQKGEYTRALSIYLRLRFPHRANLEDLPREKISRAQVYVDDAFHKKWTREAELAKEAR